MGSGRHRREGLQDLGKVYRLAKLWLYWTDINNSQHYATRYQKDVMRNVLIVIPIITPDLLLKPMEEILDVSTIPGTWFTRRERIF